MMFVAVSIDGGFDCGIQEFNHQDQQQHGDQCRALDNRLPQPERYGCQNDREHEFLAKCSFVLPCLREALRRKLCRANDPTKAGIAWFAQIFDPVSGREY